jgi:hypothetical protein
MRTLPRPTIVARSGLPVRLASSFDLLMQINALSQSFCL